MTEDWDERRDALAVGAEYCVLQNAASHPGPSQFIAGEMQTLRAIQYSRYDGSHVYQFENSDGVSKSFWLADSDPVTVLKTVFATLYQA